MQWRGMCGREWVLSSILIGCLAPACGPPWAPADGGEFSDFGVDQHFPEDAGGLSDQAYLPDFGIASADLGNVDLLAADLTLAPCPGFNTPQRYPASMSALDQILVGDLNNDGNPDVVAPDAGGSEVFIFLGDGQGGFVKPTIVQAGTDGEFGAALGDFNRDGKLDMAVTDGGNGGGARIYIFLGKGDGTFAPPQQLVTGSGPRQVVAGDLDGDGTLDLVVGSWTRLVGEPTDIISVFLGKGDGTFGPRVDQTPVSTPMYLALADLDLDGKLDLAVASSVDHQVSVLLGDGKGAFGPPMLISNRLLQLTGIEAALMDGDKLPDLLVADVAEDVVAIARGKGGGAYLAPAAFPTGKGPLALAVGDVDRDGHLDVVTVNGGTIPKNTDATFSVLYGDGNGNLAAPSTCAIYNGPTATRLVDLNHDRKLDLVIAYTDVDAHIDVLLAK